MPLPRHFQKEASLWRSRHSDWKYVLWRRGMVEALLAQAPESIRRAYATFTRGAQRADLARYLILQRHGGVYVDLDVTCLRNVGPLLRSAGGAQTVLFIEAMQSEAAARHIGVVEPIRSGVPQRTTRVANYAMAAVPHAPLMDRVMSLLVERAHLSVKSDYDVIYTTGPDVVSEAVHATGAAGRGVLVPQRVSRLYLRHRCTGTWREARDRDPDSAISFPGSRR